MSDGTMLQGSIVALVTPMAADGNVDRKALLRLLDLHLHSGTSAVVVAGTTGESASLQVNEYRELLSVVLEYLNGRLPVIAGVGSPSTANASALARIATTCGVAALLCVTPYYLRTTQEGLYRHYETLCEHSDLPMVLYNVPSRTANDLLPETVGRLQERSQIVGIKEAVPGSARVRALRLACGDDFVILSGDDATFVEAMAAGARGVISVTANVAPLAMAKLCQAVVDGESERVDRYQAALEPLHALLSTEPNPIPIKGMMCKLGWIQPYVRLPLVTPSPVLLDKIEAFVGGFSGELLARRVV